MKKIVALVLSLVFALSLSLVAFASEFSPVNYYVEYGEGTATVVFQASTLEAFDFGIIYDPNELTISECDYADDFYDLAMDDKYTTVYVKNPVAIDKAGENTYVVFTGVAIEAEDASYIVYADKDLAKVTFTNIDEGDEIGIVMGTATVQDIRNAEKIGAVDLYNQMEISDSDIFDGAKSEPNGSSNSGNSSSNWIYVIIILVIVIVAVAAVIMSKKNGNGAVEKSNDDVKESEDEE